MKNKNILFRADSSSIIGVGHIKRSLVLAKKYKKKSNNIFFACQDLEHNINNTIVQEGYTLEIITSHSIKQINRVIKKHNINMLIIDHYKIDLKYEQKLKLLNPDLIIMVLDDTYEKHSCDILLNHNIYAKKKDYKNLVSKKCKLLCGEKYTLIRDEFKKEKYIKYKKENSIFLAMGGADTTNLNLSILKVLEEFQSYKVNIITTTSNQNLKELESHCKNNKQVKLHVNSNKIAQLISKSTFGIITPSVTANECHFMNLPIIAIKTASNQKYMYSYLKKKEYLILKKFNIKKLKNNIAIMLKRLG